MQVILDALLLMCFNHPVCEAQMRDCMTPYQRAYEGKKLYSSINFAIMEKCYWGDYIPQDHRPGMKLPITYHENREYYGHD